MKVTAPCKETFITEGTGDIILGGPSGTYLGFASDLVNGDTSPYMAADQANIDLAVDWELGILTYHSGSNSVSRTVIRRSTNGNTLVDWKSGTKYIWSMPLDTVEFVPGGRPADIANLVAALGGDLIVQGIYDSRYNVLAFDGSAVDKWGDARGDNFGPVLTASGVTRPTYDVYTQTIRFDGVDDRLVSVSNALYNFGGTTKALAYVGSNPAPGNVANLSAIDAFGIVGNAGVIQAYAGGGLISSGVATSKIRRLTVISKDIGIVSYIDIPDNSRVTANVAASRVEFKLLEIGSLQGTSYTPAVVRSVIILSRAATVSDIAIIKAWATRYHSIGFEHAPASRRFNVRNYGALGDGSSALVAAQAAYADARALAPGGADIYFPEGDYGLPALFKISNAFRITGDGKDISRIILTDVVADGRIGIQFMTDDGSQVLNPAIIGIGIYSADTTYQKIAVDIVDATGGIFHDFYIYGAGTGTPGAPYFSGGAAGSIGLRTRGRDTLSFRDYQIFADRPIYIDANPNTARTDGEDADHFQFDNAYLVAKGYPCIEAAPGLGLMECRWGGYQAWVGGTSGFRMNDTRVTPVVPSRGIGFGNIRREQCQDPAAYAFDIKAVAHIQQLQMDLVLCAIGGHGIKLDGVLHANLDNITTAIEAGKNALLVQGAIGGCVVDMEACYWQGLSALFTLTSYIPTIIKAWETGTSVGPQSATYAVTRNNTLVYTDIVNAVTALKVGANQVVGARGAAVIDATDAASAITQLNALLARLRTHGLIA